MWNNITKRSDISEDLKSIAEGYAKPHDQKLEKMSGKRFIKTHLPISLSTPSIFEVGCKVSIW